MSGLRQVVAISAQVWLVLAVAGVQWLGVRPAEAAGGLQITPARIDVTVASGEPAPAGTFLVKNTSPKTLTVTVEDNVSWLTLSPTSFTLSPGATQSIAYSTVARAVGGPYIAKIYFTAKYAVGRANAPVARTLVRFFYRAVASKTDLVVSDLVITPSTTVACGQPFSVKATLKNAGAKFSGTFRIKWNQNNAPFYLGNHPSLAGGATSGDYTTVLNFKKGKPKGAYMFQFFSDSNNKVVESNDLNNNSSGKTVTVSCP